MSKQISRKRIVELAQESTEEPHKFDDGWIVRFMTRLAQEDPTLAAAVKKAANKKAKELNVKTI
jgi:hypothetical protein